MRNRLLLATLCVILVPACGSDSDSGAIAPSTVPVASAPVTAVAGGTVAAPAGSPEEGTAVVIPAGALPGDTTVTIEKVVSGSAYPDNVLTYQFGPEGTVFSSPVTITLKYSQAYLDATGLTANDLRVAHRSGSNPPEILTPTAVDTVAKTLTVQTDHFSTFSALGFSNELLTGPYYVISHFYDPGEFQGIMPMVGTPLPAPAGFGDRFGIVTFDGAGNLSVSMTERRDGSTTPDNGSDVYSVSSTGVLSLGGTTGFVQPDGTFFVGAGQTADPEKEILLGIRREGTFTTASLSGAFYFVGIEMDQSITQPNAPSVGAPLPLVYGFGATWGEIVFDGLGGLTVTETFKEGNGSTSSDSDSLSYTLQSNGALDIDGAKGQVLLGGRLVILSETSTAFPSQMTILVKKGPTTGQATADLNGNYGLVQFFMLDGAVQPNAPAVGSPLPSRRGFGTRWGTVTFAGNGTGSFTGTSNINGTIAPEIDPSVTYTVAANGAFDIGGETGFVAEGGDLILFTNPNPGEDVMIGLLLRR